MNNKLIKNIALSSLIIFGMTIVFVALKTGNGLNNRKVVTQDNSVVESTTESVEKIAETQPSTIVSATSPQVVVDTRCLITISGKTYDVTTYRKQHSGGDIFKCGKDMTSIFFSKHGNSYLKQMQEYLVK